MVVPFGIGVGDFIAVSKLIYQVGAELKRNPESAAYYQSVVIDLEALDRALKQLQSLQPAGNDLKRLEFVKAIAVSCRIPLETFLQKISRFESSLGPWKRNTALVGGYGRRVQWSLIYKNAVTELREKLAPSLSTINILLLTQTTESLAKAEIDRKGIVQEVAGKLFRHKLLLMNIADKMASMSVTQDDLKNDQNEVKTQLNDQHQNILEVKSKVGGLLKHAEDHNKHLTRHETQIEEIQRSNFMLKAQTDTTLATALSSQEDIASIKRLNNSILSRTLHIMTIVTAGISDIHSISTLIYMLKHILTSFTNEMRQTVFRLLQEFQEMQAKLVLIERLLPRQIDLPSIRFRDAFNEVRLLPYDLSRDWTIFQMFVTAAFTNRQGLHRVEMGQYFITHARMGKKLSPAFWTNAIKPGDELGMTIILDNIGAEDNVCPFPACCASTEGVEISSEGKRCPNCHRLSVISQGAPHSSDFVASTDEVPVRVTAARGGHSVISAPDSELSAGTSTDTNDQPEEDIELYYSIEVVKRKLGDASLIPSPSGNFDIEGTAGEEEKLDPAYRKRPDARTFFCEGRVFAFLWHEKVGTSAKPGKEPIFSHIRRMVVLKQREGYCWCLAINTYGGNGVAKKFLKPAERKAHTIIHMSNVKPIKHPNEVGMDKQPIAVEMAPGQTLNSMSRLSFGRFYSVQWNVKAKNVGNVHLNSMSFFLNYWRDEMFG